MPATKKTEDRLAFAKPPEAIPEPAPHTLLSQFNAVNRTEVTTIIPTAHYQRLMKLNVSLDEFMGQGLVDMISKSTGLVRAEKTKPRHEWYLYEAEVAGYKAKVLGKGKSYSVVPHYKVTRKMAKKRVPLPEYETTLYTIPKNPDQKTAIKFNLPVTLFNCAVRLSDYFQMDNNNLLEQVVEIGLWVEEGKLIQSESAANVKRYRAFTQRDEDKANQLAEQVAARINKELN